MPVFSPVGGGLTAILARLLLGGGLDPNALQSWLPWGALVPSAQGRVSFWEDRADALFFTTYSAAAEHHAMRATLTAAPQLPRAVTAALFAVAAVGLTQADADALFGATTSAAEARAAWAALPRALNGWAEFAADRYS